MDKKRKITSAENSIPASIKEEGQGTDPPKKRKEISQWGSGEEKGDWQM